MNKIFLGIVLAALLCLVGGPFATGLVAESQLTDRIARMSANNPWLNAEVTAYDRGWFSSHATVELAITPGDDPPLLPVLNSDAVLAWLTRPVPIAIDLRHGPVNFGDSLHFGVAQVTARPDADSDGVRELTEMLAVPYLFEFRGDAGFGGTFAFDADMPAFTYSSELGDTRFSGLMLEGAATGSELRMHGRFDEAGIQGMLAAGAIEAVAFDMVYSFREDRLPLSEGSLTIEHAVASSPLMGTEPLFELAGLEIAQSIRLASGGDSLDAEVRYASDRLSTGGGVDLTAIEVGIRLNGIDSQAATDYYAIMDRALDTPELESEMLMSALVPVLDALVRRGFAIDIDPAGFSMGPGMLSAGADIVIDGSRLPADASADVRNIAVLLGVLTVDAELTVSKDLARQLAGKAMRPQIAMAGAGNGEPLSEAQLSAAADAQAGLTIAMLANQGLLEDDGTDYRVAAQFIDGALTVNGVVLGPGLL